jgi:hypothetical protein
MKTDLPRGRERDDSGGRYDSRRRTDLPRPESDTARAAARIEELLVELSRLEPAGLVDDVSRFFYRRDRDFRVIVETLRQECEQMRRENEELRRTNAELERKYEKEVEKNIALEKKVMHERECGVITVNIHEDRPLPQEIVAGFDGFFEHLDDFTDQIVKEIASGSPLPEGVKRRLRAELDEIFVRNILVGPLLEASRPEDADVATTIRSHLAARNIHLSDDVGLARLVGKGLDLVFNEIAKTEVRGELFLVEDGIERAFDPTAQELDSGCPEDGVVLHTVYPGYRTRDKSVVVYKKPRVYTEKMADGTGRL